MVDSGRPEKRAACPANRWCDTRLVSKVERWTILTPGTALASSKA